MGDKNFMGGLLGGLAQGLQQQQEMTQKKEYQKSVIDINKLHGKLFEAQARLAEIKGQGMPKDLMDALNRTEAMGTTGPVAAPGAGQMAPTAAPAPQAAAQPQGPMWGPGSVPRQMAQGQIQIPGDPANNISVRQNNPFNLKDVGQAGSQGAGTRGFAIFNSPEEGVQAGIRQIQLDQARGLPFAKFAEKYAPAYENPGWAADVAKLAGITDPNTPINQIPTMKLAQAVATRESQTMIGGAGGGGQPATPQAQPQPHQGQQPGEGQLVTPIFPKETGIAGLPLGTRMALDIYLKQNFDMNTKFHESGGSFSAIGDALKGFTITNRKTGQVFYTPPTAVKMGRLPVTGQRGEEGITFAPDSFQQPIGQPNTAPPGVAGASGGVTPYMQTKPGPQDMIQPVAQKVSEDLRAANDQLGQLDHMTELVKEAKDSNWGFWAATKHQAFQDETDPISALKRAGFRALGESPTPEAIKFRVGLEKFNSAIRNQLYGGALSPQEAAAYQRQALTATTKEQYLAVMNDMRVTVSKRLQSRVQEAASTPNNALQQSARKSLGVTPPNLRTEDTRGMQVKPFVNGFPPGTKPTNKTSGGKPVYQLPDGRYVVQ